MSSGEENPWEELSSVDDNIEEALAGLERISCQDVIPECREMLITACTSARERLHTIRNEDLTQIGNALNGYTPY